MKKFILLFLLAFTISLAGFSQAPGIFNYQGVARNSVGNVLINQNITLRLSIHDGTATGPVVYSETRAMTTNPFGLFNAQVGSAGATSVTGTIAGVNWAVGNKYIQVEIDPAGGSSFINIGTAQLASVPYSIFAQTAGDIVLPFTKSQASASTLFGLTNTGTGGAGSFSINNAANGSDALSAATNGTGWAGSFTSTNATTRALRTVGGLRFTGIGEANNRILSSDATGNATWKDASSIGIVTGTGTIDRVPKWTPAGTNLGDSRIEDRTGTAPIGINTPAGYTYTSVQPGIEMTTSVATAQTRIVLRDQSDGGDVIGIVDGRTSPTAALSAMQLGTLTNHPITFFSNNNVVGRWSPAGNLGIATAAGVDPTARLQIANATTGTSSFLLNQTDAANGTVAMGLSKTFVSGNVVRSLLGAAPSTSIATAGSVYGESNTGLGVIGVSGSQNGVYGLSTGTLGGTVGVNTGSGNGLWGVNTGTGRAALLEMSNAASTSASMTLNANHIGAGIEVNLTNPGSGARGVDVNHGGVGPGVFATSAGNAVWGITTSISSAGVIGDNTFGEAVVGRNRGGNGVGAVVGRNDSTGYGVRGFNTKNGIGVLGQAGISGGTGRGGRFENVNAANTSNTVEVETNGIGSGILVELTNNANGARGIDVNQNGVGPGVFAVSRGGNAVWGITSSISAAGVIGDNTFGEAVVGRNRGGNGVGAVVGRNDSTGYGVRGFNTKDGIGVLGQAGISGGTGIGGRFENVNAANSTPVLQAAGNGTGATLLVSNANAGAIDLAVFQKGGVGNVARIDATGRGFFNGGTQTGGADIAEAFDVEGSTTEYEPGDVLAISTNSDRAVTKSSEPYSTLVVGVYATKPGVLLTEENVDSKLEGKVPMGVVGVIPTKVCLEGGAIKRGDMLVTSSISGVAMKADPAKVQVGQVIGKALQDYNATSVGKINVLVSIK